jgi:hypothetical protein
MKYQLSVRDQLRFRELQLVFFQGMNKYPNDAERTEQGLQLIESFIADLVNRECNAIIAQAAQLDQGGKIVKSNKFKN